MSNIICTVLLIYYGHRVEDLNVAIYLATLTAAWLAQLVERQSAVREVDGSSSSPDQGLKITEENVLPL